MPLTPREALGNKPEIMRVKVNEICSQIDEKLSRDFDGTAGVTFRVLADLHYWIVDQVARAYEEKGLVVNRQRVSYSDMREHTPDEWEFLFTCNEKVL